VPKEQSNLQRQAKAFSYRVLMWAKTKLPLGVRSVVGLLFMVGGVFGFLPILGFWMLPLGLALIALDLPPTRKSIERWIERLKEDLDT
jgi:hypothetical protein|tara:strand:- start:101 stop:364 length:264 start_codon:yes stop_codon:yes gene_type:complete